MYYVEGLNYNLLSVSQLSNLGCKVDFKNKIDKIYDIDGKLIGKDDQTIGNLFYLDIEDILVYCRIWWCVVMAQEVMSC